MHSVKPTLLVLAALIGALILPGIARSQGHNAVVLLTSTGMNEQERSAFDAVLDTLVAELGREDQLGVVMYSDIVEHVVPLSPVSIALKEDVVAAMASLSASAEVNGAVGYERALVELNRVATEKSLIVFSNMGVSLPDEEMTGKYTRWLQSTLLPRAAQYEIKTLILSSEPVSVDVQSTIDQQPVGQLLAPASGLQNAVADVRKHLHLQPGVAALAESTISESEGANISNNAVAVEATKTVPGAVGVEAESDPVTTTATRLETPLSNAVDEPASASSPAELTSDAPSRHWFDSLANLAMIPVIVLSGLVVVLALAAAWYLIKRFANRSTQRNPRSVSRAKQAVTRQTTTSPDIGYPWDEETTDDTLSSRATDSMDDREGGTIIQPRKPTNDNKTGNSGHADLTQELEDITRKRQSEYDFD